ncbi:hypothetical protein SPI_08327 [Niveomyces insectorum RCEF 264]|uniref:Uncharacterized protein n=1 Tax=Niveomyces insectorum RCEF 264 TaxID=1081102 RepID=A0A167N7U5_9HYPO|nr:hypothetical protein SPI_08327 [Niveomyces insectorum RCEF 264]
MSRGDSMDGNDLFMPRYEWPPANSGGPHHQDLQETVPAGGGGSRRLKPEDVEPTSAGRNKILYTIPAADPMTVARERARMSVAQQLQNNNNTNTNTNNNSAAGPVSTTGPQDKRTVVPTRLVAANEPATTTSAAMTTATATATVMAGPVSEVTRPVATRGGQQTASQPVNQLNDRPLQPVLSSSNMWQTAGSVARGRNPGRWPNAKEAAPRQTQHTEEPSRTAACAGLRQPVTLHVPDRPNKGDLLPQSTGTVTFQDELLETSTTDSSPVAERRAAHSPPPIVGIQVDQDLRDWLLFTNYHDVSYRTQLLTRRRRLAALEAEREALLAEEAAEATGAVHRQIVAGKLPPLHGNNPGHGQGQGQKHVLKQHKVQTLASPTACHTPPPFAGTASQWAAATPASAAVGEGASPLPVTTATKQ